LNFEVNLSGSRWKRIDWTGSSGDRLGDSQ